MWAILQSMRHFHSDYWGRHLVVYSDHRPIIESFKNPDLQLHDPITLNWLNEIGMHTYDIRHIEGKLNVCADQLSRQVGTPLGEAYKMPEAIAALDSVQLEGLSPEAIREAQQVCKQVECHRRGNLPEGVKVEDVEVSPGVKLLCEVSGDRPRPLLPEKFQALVLFQSCSFFMIKVEI